MTDVLLEFGDVEIIRSSSDDKKSASLWCLETRGATGRARYEFMISAVPDLLCQPLAMILRQLTEFSVKANQFYARDELDLGLGRIQFLKTRDRFLEICDSDNVEQVHPSGTKTRSKPEAPPANDMARRSRAPRLFANLAADAGWYYFSNEDYASAADFFRAALEYRPESIQAHCGLGLCLARNEEFEQAANSLQSGIESANARLDSLLPQLLFQNGLLHHEMAVIAEEQGEKQQFREHLQLALENFDRSLKWDAAPEVLFHRARTHKLRGDENSAEEDLQRVLNQEEELNPPALRIAIAELCRLRGTFTVAIRDFEGQTLRQVLDEVTENFAL